MKVGYALLAITAGAIAVLLSFRPEAINHDAAMFMDCGRMLVEGMRPYVDFSDLNPPMIMYVSALPAWGAKVSPLTPVVVFNLFVLTLALYAAGASFRLLTRSGLNILPAEAGLLALAVLIFSAGLSWTGDHDWGQREHLFLLLYLPLFFCRWIRWEGGRLGKALPPLAGLLAGIAACLKPHFVLLGFAVEGFYLVRHRRWRPFVAPEALLLVLAGMAYLLHFFFLPETIRQTYFGYLVPLIREGYGAYARPVSEILTNPGVTVAVFGAVIGAAAVGREAGPRGSMVRAFAVMALVGVALYVQQGKGWSYHLIPAVFAGLAAFAMGAACHAASLRDRPVRRRRLVLLLVIGAVAFLQTLRWGLYERVEAGPSREVVAEFLTQTTRPGDAVLMISTSVAEVYPLLLNVDRPSGSRYLWTFPLPLLYADHPGAPEGAFPYRSRDSMGADERRFLSELSADIAQRRPAVILLKEGGPPQGCPPGFSLPGYFEAADFLNRDMAGYRFWNRIFGWRVYVPESSPLRAGPAAGHD